MRGLGGIFDIFGQTTSENLRLFGGDDPDTCKARVSNGLASTDADIRDVEDNWETNGFYTIEQISNIIDFGVAVRVAAGAMLQAAQNQLQVPSQRVILNESFADLVADKRLDEMPFTLGIEQAQAQGIKIIEAQGLKRWIIYTLQAARGAKADALFVECARPSSILGAIAKIDAALRTFVDVVKKTVTAIADAAKAAGAAVLAIPDLIGSLIKFAKITFWVALLGGSYYVAAKHRVIPSRYEPLKIADRTAGRETFRPWRRS